MSDGPSKMAPPEAMPLDDLILDDEPTEKTPPVVAKSSRPPPADSSARGARDSVRPVPDEAKDTKKRAKLTLRIPDDEVARPTQPSSSPALPAATPSRRSSPDGALSSHELPPVTSTRIVSIGNPDDTLEMPPLQMDAPEPTPARAKGLDPAQEEGWTPFQPSVADSALAPPAFGGSASAPRQRAAALLDPREELSAIDAPLSEEIPVDTEDEQSPDTAEEVVTNPRLLDSEDIKLDDGDRPTEIDAEAEVEVDDLVSVESLPKPAPPPPPKKEPAHRAPAPSTPTATALMAGATPQVPPVKPLPPPVSPPAKRPQVPLIVPPVGGLAPPPMTEAAANKKKIRPWWEELFNDDFIRTMAKISDRQISREVDFIEESLGCEAGAMILDLACGTGRHCVELATRGYQVVGFDLSLSMLARASDEAHDRKQKINFVQGDMRDMTFEDTFDGVFSWNTSFGFFDEEKNAAVVAKVHKALKKGGQFLLDVANRDYVARQSPSLAWYEGDGCICMDEMHVDFITSRMKVKRTLMMDDGRTKEIEYSIRIYSLHELGKLLHDNGFRVAEVSGRMGTPGVFFGCESPRTLILAEKR